MTLRHFGRRHIYAPGLAIVVRGFGSVVQFTLNVVLGRLLSATGYGSYSLYISWSHILAALGALGLPMYTLRTVSAMTETGKKEKVLDLIVRSLFVPVGIGAIIAAAVWFSADHIAEALFGTRKLAYVLHAACLTGILLTSLRILVEALKASGNANTALTLEFTAVPVGVLVLLGIMAIFADIDWPGQAVWAHVSMTLFAMAVAFGIFQRRNYSELRRCGSYSRGTLDYSSLLPLWGQSLQNVLFLNLPFLLLPLFATGEEIGQFGAAFRLVALASTILGALASVMAPRFAWQHAHQDARGLAHQLRLSQILSAAAYLPFFLAFTLFGAPILGLFGQEFVAARMILLILSIGQLVNSCSGLVGYFLNMVHREKWTLIITFISLILMVGLCFALGRYGVLGITVAFSVALATRNLMSLVAAIIVIRYDFVAKSHLS